MTRYSLLACVYITKVYKVYYKFAAKFKRLWSKLSLLTGPRTENLTSEPGNHDIQSS